MRGEGEWEGGVQKSYTRKDPINERIIERTL